MQTKTIQERLDSLKDQAIIISLNHHVSELIAKSEEEQHVCLGDQCENNILSKCKGNEASACNGNCAGHHHAKELDQHGNEIITKSFGSTSATPPGQVTFDDGTVGFYLNASILN